jgi:hypothetical protein
MKNCPVNIMRFIVLKLLNLIIAIVIVASTTHAGEFKTVKYAGEFLNLGVGGRALGMGSAYCALARDVSATYWNPAGLVEIDYPQLMLMHTEQFVGIVKYDFGSFAAPFGSSRSLGLGVIRVGIDDIPVTKLRISHPDSLPTATNRSEVDHYISDAEYALFLSYAVKRSTRLSLGANVKVLHKGVGDHSAWGLGFDVAALYNPTGKLHIGFNFQDITTTVLAWDTGRREIIVPALKAGITYPVAVPIVGGFMSPAFDLDIRFEGRDYAAQLAAGRVSIDTHFGWEYQFQELLALRLGSDIGRFAAGAGISLPKLQIDYAFIGHADLGKTHRISVRLVIQDAKYRRRRE